MRICLAFWFLSFAVVWAQQTPVNPSQKVSVELQTVIVTGTFEPIPLSEANRDVVSLDTQDQPLLYNSFVDYLSTDASLDLEQRGPSGVQADLSIRGASFEQSLVLLNGLRINDAQTGHHDLDIPVPLESVARIEVLHGAGSTLYGADAVGGAVNFITAAPSRTEVRARIGFGNFGSNQQRVVASYVRSALSETVAASRDASTGFRPDRDYRSSSVSSETRFETPWGGTDLLLAGSDRPFGADQFYGDFPSWERTKSWFASISQDLGQDTTIAFGYRRHSDEFILVRDDPALYENNHISQSWQGVVRRTSTVRGQSTLAYGLDADGDGIDSNNLGHHARNRGAGYLNYDLRSLHRLFLSFGAREEIFSGGRSEFTPTLGAGFWIRDGLRLRASASRAFRLPTYTDLYYSDPANLGNPLLKPESAWSFEAGPEWNSGGRVYASVTAFNRQERDDIDYVKYAPQAPWQATNIPKVAFTGTEADLRIRIFSSQEICLGYTWLVGSQQPAPGSISKYVFNYPSNHASFSWLGQYRDAIALRTRVGVTQRVGQGAYPLWDVAASRMNGRVRPYLQLSNLSNTGYEEIPSVAMPGRSVILGVELILPGKKVRQP